MATKTVSTNEFRHYLTFQTKGVGNVDDYGQRTISWTEARSCWAKLEVKQAGEVVDGNRKAYHSQFIFTIRYVAGLNTSMRILHRGKYYAIAAIYDKEGLGKHLVVETLLDDTMNANEVV